MFKSVNRRTDRQRLDSHPIGSSCELIDEHVRCTTARSFSPFCPIALVRVTIMSGLLFMNKFSSCLFQESAHPIKL